MPELVHRARPVLVLAALAALAASCGDRGDDDSRPRGSIVDFDVRGIVLRPVDGGPPKLIRLLPEPVGLADYTLDASRLVYSGDRGFYVADADGADVRYVRGQPFNDALNYDPAWSPDGRRIVFSNDELLDTISAHGGDLRRIGRGTNPDWSPTGDLIAFVRNWAPKAAVGDVSIARSDGSGGRIFVMPATGGPARPVGPLVGDPSGPLDWIED